MTHTHCQPQLLYKRAPCSHTHTHASASRLGNYWQSRRPTMQYVISHPRVVLYPKSNLLGPFSKEKGQGAANPPDKAPTRSGSRAGGIECIEFVNGINMIYLRMSIVAKRIHILLIETIEHVKGIHICSLKILNLLMAFTYCNRKYGFR